MELQYAGREVNRVIHRIFPPTELSSRFHTTKVPKQPLLIQSKFDNTCRICNKQIFVENNLLIAPLVNSFAGRIQRNL